MKKEGIILKDLSALKDKFVDIELIDREEKTDIVIRIGFNKGYGYRTYDRLTEE